MSVTSSPPQTRLSEHVRRSIDLAVAQWLRHPHATFAACADLRAAGISEAEIEERRRARSRDPELARILHFSVVAIITNGRPEDRDIHRLGSDADPALAGAVLAAAESSRRRTALASVLARGASPPPIDMNVGDY